jgi:hypothetical protein
MTTHLLEYPDEQPYLSRLAGAGSLRSSLEVLLAAAPENATSEQYRGLIMNDNVIGKGTASARLWAWKRLKLRYVLDPRFPEFRAFRQVMSSTGNPNDRGLTMFLMFARNDRTFRETVERCVSPHIGQPTAMIDEGCVSATIGELQVAARADWSEKSKAIMTSKLLSALKDFGVLQGSKARRLRPVRPGHEVILFALRLAKLEGLTDRQALESRWFKVLNLDLDEVISLLHAAARQGLLSFQMQAEVVDLRLPAAEVVAL